MKERVECGDEMEMNFADEYASDGCLVGDDYSRNRTPFANNITHSPDDVTRACETLVLLYENVCEMVFLCMPKCAIATSPASLATTIGYIPKRKHRVKRASGSILVAMHQRRCDMGLLLHPHPAGHGS